MAAPKAAPHGSWRSPITGDLIVSATIGLGDVRSDGDDVYWQEMRPSEGGRIVVVRRAPDGQTSDITPRGFNVRTRVHEYGGGAWAVDRGAVYFANFADQRLYRQVGFGAPEALTPEGPFRYADAVVDRRLNRLICVREDHSADDREAVNAIVSIDLGTDRAEGDAGSVLVAGNDFYSNPRLSPDAARLCWLTWHHPNMPWDECELWVADVASDGSLGAAERLAGGDGESIFQPEWSPEGVLHFVSDRSGWWNLYAWRLGQAEALCPLEAEFGLPQWVFGVSTYGFESAGRIVCAWSERGVWRLGILDPAAHRLARLDLPYTEVDSVRVAPDRVVCLVGSPTRQRAVAEIRLAGEAVAGVTLLRESGKVDVDPGYLSIPEPIEFPTSGGLTAHGLYYRPRNADFVGPEGEKPPLLVLSHGGPTSATSSTLALGRQYWTSRGFAILDVDYGGSTGYGRAYRERLNDSWGIVDVDDCANGARFLAEGGEVDSKRLAIRGGSAGGYTTLAALAFRDVFAAGASHFGVSDLGMLAEETHKFESRYLDRLVGPYPERKDVYDARSPLKHAEGFSCPVIFLQGLEDKVVPPNQAELMVDALRRRGIPVAYVTFEGEQHGFRKAESIKRALEAKLYFYSRIFEFQLPEAVEPVEIANLA